MIARIRFLMRFVLALALCTFVPLYATNDSLVRPTATYQTVPIFTNGLGSIEETYHLLAAKRAVHVARLNSYAAAGEFPLNKDFPDRLVPYFVDDNGTACAVGHLMRLDGQRELVRRIALNSNHIRIEDVHDGPLLAWIRDSGLTREECALIQPSYATIEDYRRGRQWQDEVARLQKHFADVELTLISGWQQSLIKSLISKVDEQLATNPSDPALSLSALSDALNSDEPSVRIAAAHAIAKIPNLSRQARLNALRPNLAHSDASVRFWIAVAMETIGAASARGNGEIHHRTLPVFLSTFRSGPDNLRLPALIQLANVAPETMGTSKQFRIMPEIRQAMVRACGDSNRDVSSFAKGVLDSWRWQRVAYESQRMRRHYLAASADLEALASETLALGREYAHQPQSFESLLAARSFDDVQDSIVYLLPVGTATLMAIANTEAEAEQLIDDYYRRTYANLSHAMKPPSRKTESTVSDKRQLYFIVTERQTDHEPSPKLIYVIPRPSMLSAANMQPDYWFEKDESSNQRPVSIMSPMPPLTPNPNARIRFGEVARNGVAEFATTCDIFASTMAHYALVLIDREVQETPTELSWTGRIARLRQYTPRFFEQGGGGDNVYGGGGWEFQRLRFTCDRQTGNLTLSAEPIDFPVVQLPPDDLDPEWMTSELKLMGWKPLESLDYYGDKLFPPEYQEGIDAFSENEPYTAYQMMYRRHHLEKALPQPGFIVGLQLDQRGKREMAAQYMNRAADEGKYDPATLAEVARWEFEAERYDDARRHAELALQLSPKHSVATHVIKQLDDVASRE